MVVAVIEGFKERCTLRQIFTITSEFTQKGRLQPYSFSTKKELKYVLDSLVKDRVIFKKTGRWKGKKRELYFIGPNFKEKLASFLGRKKTDFAL